MTSNWIIYFLFLISSTYKADFDNGGGLSADWSSLQRSPYVNSIQSLSQAIFLFALLYSLWKFAHQRSAYIQFSRPALWLIALLLLLSLRTSFENPSFAFKQIVAALALVTVSSLAITEAATRGIGAAIRSIYSALALNSILFIAINLQQFVSGLGYVDGFPRFFGTASHPNFLGVQAAIAFMFLSPRGLRDRPMWRLTWIATPRVLGSLGALFLVYLSGSRTALLICGSYLALITFTSTRRVWIIVPVLLISLFAFSGILPDMLSASGGLDVYDRGSIGTNTRSAAWLQMVNDTLTSPLIGNGVYKNASESSLLRWSASLGIAGGLIYLFFILDNLKLFISRQRGNIQPVHTEIRYFSASAISILAGSLFEGYLGDAFSPPILSYILSVALLNTHSRE